MADNTPGFGYADPSTLTSDFNVRDFHILQRLMRVRTMTLVSVVAVHAGAGPLDPITVDVQPLIKMLDGQGNATSHGTIFNVPVWRVQGGGNVLVVNPKIASVGVMGVCDRDISSVQSTNGKESAPGSLRTHDLADGIYFGGLFGNEEIKQSILMNDDGITVTDKSGNVLQSSSSGWMMTGNLKVNGTVEAESIETVDGNLTVKGTLDVKGATTLESTVEVKGLATFDDRAIVTGDLATFGNFNAVNVFASVNVQATVTVQGANLVAFANVFGNFGLGTVVDLLSHQHTYFEPTGPSVAAPTTAPIPGT